MFSNLLGSLGSKIAVFGFMALLSVGGYFGYDYLSTKNELLRESLKTTKQALEQQQQTIKIMRENYNSLEKAQNNLNNKFEKIEQNTSQLQKLFADHDLKNLIVEKPGLIENRVNKGSKEVLMDLEKLTNPESYVIQGKNEKEK